MKQFIRDNIKNFRGWRTGERLVAIAVDDYGNVRQDSEVSRQKLLESGLNYTSRFDKYDAVETREDLEALFDVLTSVKDGHGDSAVITPYALCANPNFDEILSKGETYRYETLAETFDRLEDRHGDAYRGAWALWHQGIRSGIFRPQFHGREHLNIRMLEEKLRNKDKVLTQNLAHRSMTAITGEPSMPGIGFTHAFGVTDLQDIEEHKMIIADGMKLFKQLFGFKSATFTPPAQKIHPGLYPYLESLGVRGIDKPFRCSPQLDQQASKLEFNVLGRKDSEGHVTVVRNVVFEPTADQELDSVNLALGQIAAAFRWRKPAIVSSHRVNFTGHIDVANRDFGLGELRRLLKGIVRRWPDVQFLSTDALVEKIEETAR